MRHGETAWNREGRLQGWQDVPLSADGVAQAHRLAARLAHLYLWEAAQSGSPPATAFIPGPPCAVYASDLSRAADTARIIAEAITPQNENPLLVQQTSGLRERYFGEREGFTAGEAQAKWGDNASHHNIGETYTEVNDRMEAVLRTLWGTHAASDDENRAAVLVAGHGGSLRLWLCRAAGLGPDKVRHFHLDNTSLSVVTFTGADLARSEGRILLCNDTAHLQTAQTV